MPQTREKPVGTALVAPGKKKTTKKGKKHPKKTVASTALVAPGKKKAVPPRVKEHPPKKVTRQKSFHFTALDGNVHMLTVQQKEFCEYFCQFHLNGIDAIIKAGYNVNGRSGKTNYKLAAEMSRENLLKPGISAYIEILLERYGLTDDNVDKQLLLLINQNVDLSTKRGAIDIYYKKKGLYAPTKIDPGESINGVTEALLRLGKLLP